MATKRRKRSTRTIMHAERVNQPVRFEMVLPPDLPIHYVDNINVIHTPTEFTISFLQSQPPLISDIKQWEKIERIPARCVARIVVNPLKMQDMLRALTINFQAFVKTYMNLEVDSARDDTQTKNASNSRKQISSKSKNV